MAVGTFLTCTIFFFFFFFFFSRPLSLQDSLSTSIPLHDLFFFCLFVCLFVRSFICLFAFFQFGGGGGGGVVYCCNS